MEFFTKYKMLLSLIGFLGIVSTLITYFYFYKTGSSFMNIRSKKKFSIPTSGVKKITLANGMNVLMLKNTTVPKVLVQIAYNVGSATEQEGERGLAHLLEHMIFKGTEKLSEADLDAIARKYGASYNAYTTIDVTSYYFEANKNNVDPFIDILADCMQNARFDEQHLASELKAVIQELKMYRDDYWNVMFKKAFEQLFTANHPYHHPIIGYKEDLMDLSAANLKRFYQKYYQPNKAALFIVGDIDETALEQKIRATFEPIKGVAQASGAIFPAHHENLTSSKITLYEDVQSNRLGLFCRIPGLRDKHEIVSSALAYMLGDGEGSRLYRMLVDEKQIATAVEAGTYKLQEGGMFYVLVEPVAGKTNECIELIKRVLHAAGQDGFTAQELDHMVKAKAKGLLTAMQKASNITFEWINSFFAHGDEYAFFNRINRYEEITSAAVQQFVKETIHQDLMTIIEVVPLLQGMQSLSEKSKLEADAMDAQILQKYQRTVPLESPRFALTMPEPKQLDFIFPKPDKVVVLENGLRVLLKQNKNLPLITVDCHFKNAFYNTASREGTIINCMMDLLIEGTVGYTKNENVDFFDNYGTDYYFGISSAGLSMLAIEPAAQIKRFIKIMTEPTFPNNAINKICAIHQDSLMRNKESAQDVLFRALKSKMYPGHPFGWTFDEALQDLKTISQSALKALHKKMIAASQMVVSVVGDFELNEMESIIRQEFAALPVGNFEKMVYPKVSFKPGELIDIPMVRDQVVLALARPSVMNIHHEDAVPARLLNYIAFSSLGSRLFQLREECGLFYTAFGGIGAHVSDEYGFDYVGAILSPDKVQETEMLMHGFIAKLAKEGVLDAEVAAARQLYLKSLIDAVSSNSAVASLFGTLEEYGLGFDYYDKVLARIQTLTAQDISALCKKYATTEGMIRIRAGRILTNS